MKYYLKADPIGEYVTSVDRHDWAPASEEELDLFGASEMARREARRGKVVACETQAAEEMDALVKRWIDAGYWDHPVPLPSEIAQREESPG